MVTKYIRQGIIPYDIAHNNFALKHREEKITLRHDFGDGRKVLLGGYADRIDSMDDGTIRVVDYKTGSKKFARSDVEIGINVQLLLYLFSVLRCPPGKFREISQENLNFTCNLSKGCYNKQDIFHEGVFLQ